jgi:hypothetical protein
MAGRGPTPKDPARRARRNADPTALTVLTFQPAAQPPLPAGFPWPDRTQAWWAAWRDSPQAVLFSATDWEFLFDTALLHATAWSSAERALSTGEKIDTSQHSELRLRVAKFGATIEDRARLRITFALADEKDAARSAPTRQPHKWGDLRALPPAK